MASARPRPAKAAKRAKTTAKTGPKRPAAKRAAARKAGAKPAAAKRTGAARPAGKRVAGTTGAARKAASAKPATARKTAAAKPAVARKSVAAQPAKPVKDVRAARSRAPKTFPTDASVLAFLERVRDPAVRADCVALNALLSQVTGAPPRMWGSSIVGFGQYRYRYSSGHEGDWPVCGYSPRKQNLTVYVMAGFERFPQLMQRLGRYKTGKSCLYIDRLADIDAGVLRELVAASNEQLRRMYG
jgi:hypothetical protein